MSSLTPHLRRVQGGYAHWCPGCNHAHIYYVDREGPGPRWQFNGNVDKPSFTPSMRIFTPAHVDEDDGPQPERTDCHYFVTDGQIVFCGDSAHALAGQTVPLPVMKTEEEYGYPP